MFSSNDQLTKQTLVRTRQWDEFAESIVIHSANHLISTWTTDRCKNTQSWVNGTGNKKVIGWRSCDSGLILKFYKHRDPVTTNDDSAKWIWSWRGQSGCDATVMTSNHYMRTYDIIMVHPFCSSRSVNLLRSGHQYSQNNTDHRSVRDWHSRHYIALCCYNTKDQNINNI